MNELDKKLYELFADKTISEGCRLIHWFSYNPEIEGEEKIGIVKNYDGRRWVSLTGGYNVDEFSILGHPPQLHDVFRVAMEKGYRPDIVSGDRFTYVIKFNRWDLKKPTCILYNPTLPLLEQSESTKSALISLFE